MPAAPAAPQVSPTAPTAWDVMELEDTLCDLLRAGLRRHGVEV